MPPRWWRPACFLVARVYPLMSAGAEPADHGAPVTTALTVVTWVGAITAFFAATIAVAQNDIKRILAYSTVSQLGYMMMGLGVGGMAVGMFHLITHAFFKALLFLGSGSVIHGCHEEQDVRKMGGLRKYMPVTFAVYAVGMLALSGFPLFFSGFWSKDEILHHAASWPVSRIAVHPGLRGRAVHGVLHDPAGGAGVLWPLSWRRRGARRRSCITATPRRKRIRLIPPMPPPTTHAPHESPAVMTVPLIILAVFAILLGVIGTPAWPWFDGYLTGEAVSLISAN